MEIRIAADPDSPGILLRMWSLAEPSLLKEKAAVLFVPLERGGMSEYAEALEECGIATMTTPNREAALTRLRWTDVVVVEMAERDTTGWDLCQAIRRRHPDVLLMIGFRAATADEGVRALEIGAIDHFQLPIDPHALQNRICCHLVRRQMSRQNAEDAERYCRLVKEAPLPLFIVDSGWFRIANRALGDLVGRPVERVVADSCLADLLVEEDRLPVMRALHRHATSGEETLRIPVRVLRQGGEPREADLTLTRIKGGAADIFSGTFLDNSRRHKAVQSGQEKEVYFRSLIEGSHEIIAVVGREGAIQYASPSAGRVLGRTTLQMIGEPLIDHVHPDDRKATVTLLGRLADVPSRAVTSRCRIGDRTGSWRMIEFTARDLTEDPVVGGIIINARDVTAEHAAEEALRSSEARFRLLVEGSRDVFFYVRDSQGRVSYVSPSVENVLGFGPQEVTARLQSCLAGGSDGRDPAGGARLASVEDREGRVVVLELVESACPEGENLTQGFARDVSERERMQTALRDAAFQDPLTALPNRALFMDRVRHAIARMKRHPDDAFAVLFLDLDRFKIVNDSLGHRVGDDLLVAVAERLEFYLRPEDTLARFGGDEFAILIEDVGEGFDAPRVASRIREVLSNPFNLGGYEVFTSASIGIVMGSVIDDAPEALLQNADMAMYRAKSNGGNSFELYDQPMHAEAIRRLELESHLRRAVERDELCLAYQPIIDLATGKVRGMEALVRWQHPSHGLIAPGDFIGLAEETGYITEIGEWVLEEAMACVADARRRVGCKDLFVSVNLSSRQLGEFAVVSKVDELMVRYDLTPRNLRLEITEGALIHNRQRAARILRELMTRGVEIYLDDFGTGYASLSYLHSLPLTGIKIDRSFVERMHTDDRYSVLVASTMDIARGLGLAVIAEGIENEEQAAALAEVNCEFAQGFYFSPPIAAEEIPELFAREIRRSVQT